ncbi:hypothetical protein U1Q18_000895, partial [Sarracenia purpurea var. burkii]
LIKFLVCDAFISTIYGDCDKGAEARDIGSSEMPSTSSPTSKMWRSKGQWTPKED